MTALAYGTASLPCDLRECRVELIVSVIRFGRIVLVCYASSRLDRLAPEGFHR